jgi:hypothetical protein
MREFNERETKQIIELAVQLREFANSTPNQNKLNRQFWTYLELFQFRGRVLSKHELVDYSYHEFDLSYAALQAGLNAYDQKRIEAKAKIAALIKKMIGVAGYVCGLAYLSFLITNLWGIILLANLLLFSFLIYKIDRW